MDGASADLLLPGNQPSIVTSAAGGNVAYVVELCCGEEFDDPLHPEVVEAMRAELARHEATLLPYPPDHRCLPEARRAALDQPAISQPD